MCEYIFDLKRTKRMTIRAIEYLFSCGSCCEYAHINMEHPDANEEQAKKWLQNHGVKIIRRRLVEVPDDFFETGSGLVDY